VRGGRLIPPPRGEGPERSEGGGGLSPSSELPSPSPGSPLRADPPSPQGGGRARVRKAAQGHDLGDQAVRGPILIPPPCGEGPERSEGGGGPSPSSEPLPPPPGSPLRAEPPSPQGGGRGRATVTRARELRKAMTRYEVRLWLRLRELRAQGFRFRRQIPLERWIVDFICFQNKLVIEVDGMQHGFERQQATDAARDAFLERAGFTVLRFTNGEVWENMDGVVETIFNRRLDASRPPPPGSLRSPPSPQGGGRGLAVGGEGGGMKSRP
jgi:very-short-patch-repair endonuclease